MNQKSKLPESEKEFARAYREHYHYVFNTIYSKIHNEHDTRDLCHDIFLSFYNKFSEINNHRAWLNGTINFVLMRYYAKKKKKQSYETDITPPPEGRKENDRSLEIKLIIEEAIKNTGLTDEEVEIFNLIARYDYSYGNTGKILGYSKRQVGYKFNRVIEKLEMYLKSRGINGISSLL